MNDDSFLADAFRRQLAALLTSGDIRAIEAGGAPTDLWRSLDESGFVDAMLPEEAGGAGLDLAQAFPLLCAAGEYCVPVPFAETVVARAMLARHGVSAPAGVPIVFVAPSAVIPSARLAGHALVDQDGVPTLMVATGAGSDLFGTGGGTEVHRGDILATLPPDEDGVLLAAAAVAAALMAGAMSKLLEMSLRHASERQQFGRSLGKFQAIQQQLAVLAEQVLSAQVAARGAFVGRTFDPVRVAAAKCRANEAAGFACNISHAIHGAIGVTAEFDLQLYTRRIKQWQLAFGSENFWGARLGKARLASSGGTTADFLRLNLATVGE